MITYEQVVGYIIPIVGTVVYGIIGIAILAGLWYYLFIVRRRRIWFVDVYEQKSDGKLYLVQKDKLVEKKINFGKQTIYVFRKTKTEAVPPPFECVERLGNKEYCSYVRILGEYVPMEKRESRLPDFYDKEIRAKIGGVVNKRLSKIRSKRTSLLSSRAVENNFIYVPLSRALKYDIDFKPISYDVNMMRINEIDNLDHIFKQKQTFWQQYGSMIIIGVGVVMVIVVAYMGFEYMRQVIAQSLGAADKVANPLNAIADKLTGSVPPT